MSRLGAIAAVCLLASGCFDPTLPTLLACSDEGNCPTGETCGVDWQCHPGELETRQLALASVSEYQVGYAQLVGVGDLDQDGLPDVVLYSSEGITLLHSSRTAPG